MKKEKEAREIEERRLEKEIKSKVSNALLRKKSIDEYINLLGGEKDYSRRIEVISLIKADLQILEREISAISDKFGK